MKTSLATPAAVEQHQVAEIVTRLHRQIVEAMDLSRAAAMDETELRDQVAALAGHLCSKHSVVVGEEDRALLTQRILDEIYGYGPLQPLMTDPAISAILVNGFDSVQIEKDGRLLRADVEFADDQHLVSFIRRTVARAGRRIDEASPMVDLRLADGSRFHAVIPPLAVSGPTISICRLAERRLTLENLVRLGTLAPAMADFLVAAVRSRSNILFSGGSGAGKTTLLNAACRFIADEHRVITIEDTPELFLAQSDVVSLETRLANVDGHGAVSRADLVRNSVRMRADRLVLGEVSGREVLGLLEAMNTGHKGSMGTIHANDGKDALDRLEIMATIDAGTNLKAVQKYIGRAIDYVVHLQRLATGERKVTRISELRGLYEGEYAFEDLYVYRFSGKTAAYKADGAFFATGCEPIGLKATVGDLLTPQHYREMFVPRQLSHTGGYKPPVSPCGAQN